MLVQSIRKSNVSAEIIQCSDFSAPAIEGVSRLERFEGRPDRLMTFRLDAFAKLGLESPAIYLDTDMLVQRPLDPARLLAGREVLLCRRDFDTASLHSGSQRGVEFPEHRGRPLGEVYPYLACATITRDARFWSELVGIIESLDERFHRWYGDQEAMRLWSEKIHSETSIGLLPEMEFGCLPERSAELNSRASILHFKGAKRKPLMKEFYARQIGNDQQRHLKNASGKKDVDDLVTYVIMTPPPNIKSAGITYLNSLAEHLRSIGKKVIQLFAVYPQEQLYVWGSSQIPIQNHWVTPWQGHWVKCEPGQLAKVFEGQRVIVIHGENQHHRWFDGLNVVRYYLNKIGALQKVGVPREGEFKLAWHPIFCPDADHILSKSMVRTDLEAATSLDLKDRSIDLSYVGKASLKDATAKRLDGTLELTRHWPNNDDEYFYLLSKTRYLFTHDTVTSVIADAIIMGAMPILMNTGSLTREQWRSSLDSSLIGCIALFDEDYAQVRLSFPESRQKFISESIKANLRFTDGLEEFSRKAESMFFG